MIRYVLAELHWGHRLSGKATGFDPVICRFDPRRPSQRFFPSDENRPRGPRGGSICGFCRRESLAGLPQAGGAVVRHRSPALGHDRLARLMTPELDAENANDAERSASLWVRRSSIRPTEFEPKCRKPAYFRPSFSYKAGHGKSCRDIPELDDRNLLYLGSGNVDASRPRFKAHLPAGKLELLQ